MLNKIQIIGRLGKTPELKTTPNGTSVSSFSVATSEKWKDGTGAKKEETQWHNVVLWGKNAESASKFMKKGELHYFEGTMKYEEYEKDGVKKVASKIHVTNFKLLPNGQNTGGHTPDDSNLPPGYTGGRSSDEPDVTPNAGSSYGEDVPF